MDKLLEEYFRDNYDVLCKSYAGFAGGLYNAEDVIMEAFARAYKYKDTFDPERSSLATWFGRIARRSLSDFRTMETREGMTKEEATQGEEPTVELSELCVSTSHELEKEIDKLRDSHAVVVRLAILKGYQPRDIVEIVDESLSNVKYIIKMFKKDIKEKYGEY